MKIGIITYWQSNDNYGQLLQCYALQRYLVQIGHEPFLIRYDISNRYSANNKWKKVLKILMVYPVLKYLLNKKKKSQQAKLLAEISQKNTLRKFTSSEKYVVTLRYGEEQTLTLDGKNYVDPINSAINDIKYKELRFELGETNKDIMLKVYVMDLEETEKYYYVISQFGDYSNLYSYLSSIENLA